MITLLVIFNSCSTTLKFPVSRVTPAADISVKKGMDDQNNYTLEIKAKNLATADRMDPKGHNYSVWIVTISNGIKNVGQLNVKKC